MADGKLCVSVIEARNIVADEYAERNFYVKLKVNRNEIRTDVSNSMQPKFLKDCRLAVPFPETDLLTIELLQVGPRGDLIIGSDELKILSIVNRGTIVHWFEMRTHEKTVGAELCLVLRYLSAGVNRPMSPSYALEARQAKERALGSSMDFETQGISKALFRDTPSPGPRDQSPAGSHTGAYGVAPASSNVSRQSGTGRGADLYSPPASRHSGHSMARGGSGGSLHSGDGGGGVGGRNRGIRGALGRLLRTKIPLPWSLISGFAIGALVWFTKQRPVYYEVQDDDTLCHIATCFKKDSKALYERNRDLLVSPDVIYPGDRIRIN